MLRTKFSMNLFQTPFVDKVNFVISTVITIVIIQYSDYSVPLNYYYTFTLLSGWGAP